MGIALQLHGTALTVFVLASVLTDWDYVFQITSGRNHRTFITHSPPVYVALLLPLGFWNHLVWVALAGSLLHFSLDVWEYGVRLDPFRREVFGARLIPGIENMRFREYVATYFRDKRFLSAELALALAAVLLVAVRLG